MLVRDTGIEPEGSDSGRRHWWYQFDFAHRPHLHHLSGQQAHLPATVPAHASLWTGDPPTVEPRGDRGVMMPKRRHSRAANTAKAKAAERKLNDAYVAERN